MTPAGNGFKITTMKLTVTAKDHNIDDAKFKQVAEETKKTCTISMAIIGNVDLQMTATLQK